MNDAARTRPDGDGWVDCVCGRRHWGRFGAAGLLIYTSDGARPAGAGIRVLLQHRAPATHNGGTWALPGGARNSAETALEAALREADEEAGVESDSVRPCFAQVEDHGSWSYTTIVAGADQAFNAVVRNWESQGIEWVDAEAVPDRPLHHAFARSWPELFAMIGDSVTLVVDAANVMGSRPDGWWNDRLGAAGRLRDGLARLAPRGINGRALGEPDAAYWFPRIVLVTEGQARPLEPVAGVEVVAARGQGDDEIVRQTILAVASRHRNRVRVVTADHGLTARVEAEGALTWSPSSLLRVI